MLQVVVIYAANYVLVALSIDRYDAITHPLKFSGSCEFLILNNDKIASNNDLLLNKYCLYNSFYREESSTFDRHSMGSFLHFRHSNSIFIP